MNTKGLHVALDKDTDEMKHISSVISGLKCNCICPSCKDTLIAKKGNKQEHHFAHHNSNPCKNGYETSIHLYVKDVLLNCSSFILPPHKYNNHPTRIKFNNVIAEKRYKDIIPDITAVIGSKTLFIEVHVFNAVDEIKSTKIKQYGISTLEIDVREMGFDTKEFNSEDVTNIIVNSLHFKKWIYNAHQEQERERITSERKERMKYNRQKLNKIKLRVKQRKLDLKKQELERIERERLARLEIQRIENINRIERELRKKTSQELVDDNTIDSRTRVNRKAHYEHYKYIKTSLHDIENKLGCRIYYPKPCMSCSWGIMEPIHKRNSIYLKCTNCKTMSKSYYFKQNNTIILNYTDFFKVFTHNIDEYIIDKLKICKHRLK